MSMEDIKALTENAECSWDYIDRLRMALASACKDRDELKKQLHESKSELLKCREADQDGRLVVLPCKVVCGTTIWWADSNIHTNPVKCEVSSFGIYTGPDGELQLWMNCYVYGPTPMSRSFRVSSICKTVFLTREEAEAALDGKGSKNE